MRGGKYQYILILSVLVFILCNIVPISGETGSSGIGSSGVPFEIFLGRKLFSEGKYEEAAKLFEVARERGQASGKDLALLGISYYRMGDAEKAEGLLNEAKERYPEEPLVYVGYGYIAFGKKDFKGALGLFRKAEELAPALPEAKNGIVASYINLGVAAYSKGKPDEAEKYFKKALTEKPDSAEALTNIGILKLDRGKLDEAIDYFNRAHKYKPGDARILKLLAEALKERDGYKGKELLFVAERLSKANPYDPYPYEVMGRIYELKGEAEKALGAFSEAYKRGSEDPYVYYWLARYRYRKGEREKAASLLYLAVGKAVHRIGAIQVGAARRIQAKKGKLGKEDIKALKKYSQLVEEPKSILENSLELLEKVRGSKETFERDMQKLTSWYPHSVDIQVEYGKLLEREGKWEKAVSLWQDVAEKHPYNTEAHLGLARSYEKLGDTSGAILECKKAIDTDDKNAESYDLLIRLYCNYGSKAKYDELVSFLNDRFEINKYNEVLIKALIKAYEKGYGGAGRNVKAEAMREWLKHVEGFKKK